MVHSVWEAVIGVMLGLRIIESLRGSPPAHPRLRAPFPREGPGRDDLGRTVKGDGAVGGGPSEKVSPNRFRRVAVGPRIHDVRLSEGGALNAEEVGVAVSPGLREADGPHVEDQLMGVPLPSASHHGVPSSREQAGERIDGRSGGERFEDLCGRRPKQPDGFRRQAAGRPGVVGPAEESRCHREDAPEIVGGSRDERKEPSAVGIADLRHRAVRATNHHEEVEQPLEPVCHGVRHFDLVSGGQDQEVKIDLRRVALVACRLFKVDAVRENLTLALLNEDLRAPRAPAPRPR